jgi:hypothetical protein
MKRINYIIISTIAFALINGSCRKEYLDTFPTQAVGAEQAISNTSNAMASLNGIHRSMYTYLTNQDEGGEGAMNINRDVLGEDYVMTATGNGWFNTTYQWSAHRGETSAQDYFPWRLYYKFIANANIIIDNIDNATGIPALKRAIKGEALCFRAWSHFQLVQLYAGRYEATTVPNSQPGIPVMVTSNYDGQPRATVEEVYKQIIKDLDSAIVDLTGYSRSNNSHFNIDVARGIRARVALTMQDWVTAATMAGLARIGSGTPAAPKYTLMTNAEYKAGFDLFTNKEWMWGSGIISDQTIGFSSFLAYVSRNYSSGNIRSNPKAINSALYNNPIFTSSDVRKANFDPTGLHAGLGLTSDFLKKPYTSQKFLTAGSGDVKGDVVYMRAAEMYLIEAEAYARMGGQETAAKTALNALRQNRETVPANYVASTATGTALINEILLNRRLELWGEGFRFTDLKRLNLSLDRTGANHTLALCIETSIPAGDVRWEWLIPRQELDANKKMVQNPL